MLGARYRADPLSRRLGTGGSHPRKSAGSNPRKSGGLNQRKFCRSIRYLPNDFESGLTVGLEIRPSTSDRTHAIGRASESRSRQGC
jgi:hypothetical protein